ncbi:hypothetical protein [Chromobacterium sp. IIBBL 290-4]|uniref:hypothetical protein n=1 Tax=Chromobacterium sp. IIBBL 290-4 TaxID=2953890 RepID=UPI0020B8B7F9|nr:hypothetical protein [Chromobacterium sp. IIBBL 290-4]UTH72513.1 hypothetical protein NKT35_13230 [Chromobacterium sp. IIBBL 290-4]
MNIDQKTIEHWLKYDEWTTKEAALIFLGLHPEAMKGLGINIGTSIDLIPEEFQEVARLCQVFKRADWSHLGVNYYNGKLHPAAYFQMADEKQIEIDELVLEVARKWYRNKSASTNSEGEHADVELRKLERDSLFKIVIGWAISIYSYDPSAKRNPHLSAMREDIERAGLSIDDETLRKWLREAASILPQHQTKK